MFKIFYKILLIALISVTLTAFDFSVAYAQAAAGATTAQSSNMTRDSNGVVKRTETHRTDKVDDDDMMASISMFGAAAATTTSLMFSATKPYDTMIAGAGALVLIAGEAMATMGHKTALEAMTMEITKSSDGKKDQAQIDHLNTLKKSYEDAKKTLGTKKSFETAAAVIYGVAAAAVAIEIAVCVAEATVSFGTAYAACILEYTLTGDNGSKLMNQSLYGGQRAVASHQNNKSVDTTSMINKFFDLIISRGEAGILPIALGITGSALLLIGGIATAFKSVLASPYSRLLTWAVMAGLCSAAASATQNQMDKIDENIKKIDKILTDMNALQKGTKLNQMTEQQIKLGSLEAPQGEELKLNADPNVKTDCLISEGSSNCKSIADALQGMPSYQKLPDSLKALGSQAARLGDKLSGTNTVSASAVASAKSLAGKSSAIKKMRDYTQKKLNETLTKAGKPKMDLDQEQAKHLAKMKATAAKEFKSHNLSPSEFLASVGGSPISSTAKVLDTVAKKKGEVAAVGAAAPGKAKNGLDLDLDLDLKEESPIGPELAVGSADAGLSVKNEDPDVDGNDINTDSDLNIFEVITKRYFKSGYPKLLDEVSSKK